MTFAHHCAGSTPAPNTQTHSTHLGVTGMFHSFTIGAAVAIVFTLLVGRTIQ